MSNKLWDLIISSVGMMILLAILLYFLIDVITTYNANESNLVLTLTEPTYTPLFTIKPDNTLLISTKFIAVIKFENETMIITFNE